MLLSERWSPTSRTWQKTSDDFGHGTPWLLVGVESLSLGVEFVGQTLHSPSTNCSPRMRQAARHSGIRTHGDENCSGLCAGARILHHFGTQAGHEGALLYTPVFPLCSVDLFARVTVLLSTTVIDVHVGFLSPRQ